MLLERVEKFCSVCATAILAVRKPQTVLTADTAVAHATEQVKPLSVFL